MCQECSKYFSLYITPSDWFSCYHHFADKETEAQMGLSKFPKDIQLRSDKPWIEPPSGTQNMMKRILAT